MGFKDLRSFIHFLEEKKELVRLKEVVNPKYELSAITSKFDGGPAVLFEKVKGYKIQVVTGIFSQRKRIAWVLGVNEPQLTHKIIEATENPLPSKIVETGSVKEVIVKRNINLLKLLPIPTHYELDAGPYVTSGVIIAKDPETGVKNASYARMQVKSRNKLGIMINQWRHLWTIYQKAEKLGEPLPIAIVIGAPPSVILEGAMPGALVPLSQDELDTAGALVGQPLEVVPCETIDITVPVASEIVIEGEILPKIREAEGPFGDFARVYDGILGPRLEPVVKVKAVVHRKNPIYYDILPSSEEHLLLGGILREAEIYKNIRWVFPHVKAVHLTKGGCRRFHAIIQIKKEAEADGKTVIEAALYPTEASRDVKLVIVVDEDINPFDLCDVEWAVATRVQADKDIVIMSGLAGTLDPSAIVSTPKNVLSPPAESGVAYSILTSKIGIDATRSFKDPAMLKIYEKIKAMTEAVTVKEVRASKNDS
jgi:2,5-furandicarboxylate decarboxylase 1